MSDAESATPFGEQARETARLGRLAVRLAWRASPRLVLGILALLVAQAVLTPLQLALSRAVIDRAAVDLGLAGAAGPTVARLPLAGWIALAAAALAAGQLIQPCSSTFQALVGDRLVAYVTGQLIAAANRWRGLARFEDPAFADDLERARKRAAGGGLDLLIYGAQGALALFTATALALTLAGLHPLAPLLLVGGTLPQMALQLEYRRRVFNRLYAQTPEARRLEYSRDLLLTPEPAKDVRLYDLGPFFRGRYDAIFARTVAALDRLRRPLLARVALAGLLAATAAGAVYVYTVWAVAGGRLTPGDLLLYGGAATLLQTNLLALGFSIGFLPMVFEFLPSLFRVLDAPPDLSLPSNPRPAPRPIRRGIVFEDVWFAYPDDAAPVLRGVSCRFRPGECVALVGHNGAGKTTLIKLLLRLYDPTAGRILLDGVDLREYDLDDLRREMGVIFQDFVRYELTAGENIGLGQVAALGDRARLREAAARAGAGDLLDRLPEGLDTTLGREFGGRELSGGEWQKLALARAFARDCPILVLDEPTAALDVQTEHDVYTRFRELTRDRLTVLISHRFSTVRMADRILYLAGGKVREEGSHADLLARGGEYARLYRLQAAQYLDRDHAGAEEARVKGVREWPGGVAGALRAAPGGARVLGRGLALVWAAAPGLTAVYFVLVALLGVLPPLQVWIAKRIVDDLARGVPGGSGGPALAFAVFYALTLLLPAGLRPVYQELASWLEDRAVAELDRRLMAAGTRLVDLARIERPAFGDELRLIREAAYYPPHMLVMAQRLLEPLLALGGILILLAGLHPLLPPALALITVPQLVASQRVRKRIYGAMTRRSRAAREMDYCARVTTEPAAAKEIRVFGLGAFFLRRFAERREAALTEVSRLRIGDLRLAVLFGVAQALTLAGAFWYVATQAQAGRLTLGDLALYLNAVIQAESQLLFLPTTIGFFHEALLHLRPLVAFLDGAAPAIALPPAGRGRPAPDAPGAGVELRGVSFRYPESAAPVLEGISATLPAGRVTALVGINGAGKSTLVKLLTRMYDPDGGAILLDGVPLAEYDLDALRGRIAVVYQDFARFALTLGENIAVGAAAPEEAAGRVAVAARRAGADGVAAKLPQGYDTQLTRRFEGGVELSGGEWQKVAVARGFVRDAALVILDEPTAALDAEAEEALFAGFRALVAGKTALLISHRFSTVRLADRILVLEGGRIVEAGSHAELVARGGRYAALYEMQAGRYR